MFWTCRQFRETAEHLSNPCFSVEEGSAEGFGGQNDSSRPTEDRLGPSAGVEGLGGVGVS